MNLRPGERVILCFPPGLDFSLAFWGCMYAGCIAIPVYPPYPGTLAKDLPKFNKLVDDSEAHVVLTNRTYHLASKMATLKGYLSRDRSASTTWPSVAWVSIDSVPASESLAFVQPIIGMDNVAFFQYSSGSTSSPKAVMITHRNICAQLRVWETVGHNDTMVSWLPSYHDMGLIGFIVVPIYSGARCISMSPISFIKNPSLWLKTVTEYKATHICAPNFGYSLVSRKVSKEECDHFDLASIKQAICAAEPIREDSLLSFNSAFERVGFKLSSFNCGYGLAETTLVCTGQDPRSPSVPFTLCINKEKLQVSKIAEDIDLNKESNTVELVGCGRAAPGFEVIIVDPEERRILSENHVGEIWVTGESIALGYWKQDRLSHETFSATLRNELDGKKFLRTGDLGFLRDGELFVTGRMKDLIIVNGRNIAPQDVELSVEQSHSGIRPGCVAAFSVDIQNQERLVVCTELRSKQSSHDLDIIRTSIQRRVLEDHQLSCYGIALLEPRSIPKTTSGKIQRQAARSMYLSGTLRSQHISVFDSNATHDTPVNKKSDLKSTVASKSNRYRTPEEVESWLLERITSAQSAGENETDKVKHSLEADQPWTSFGMDSVALVSLSADLSDYLEVLVPPAAFFEYGSPRQLSRAPGLLSGSIELSSTTTDESEVSSSGQIPEEYFHISYFPEVQRLKKQMDEIASAGLDIPYLDILDQEKRRMINYNTYNYLGMASNPYVAKASKEAIDEYGTSMSSSPIVGQTSVNDTLEKELCSFFGSEASVLFVGGWVTNVTVIGTIVGPKDLIICDALNHNSCVVGQKLSGATVVQFPHNDFAQADKILCQIRCKYRRVLVVIEGVYGMDGDIPDLQAFVNLKVKHKALLFVDEAHSFGTIGQTGRGICEYVGVDPSKVDIRMGTMSKSLGSTGGFILGTKSLVELLKYTAGGFVFSVGLTPANAASSLASLRIMSKSSEKTRRLQCIACRFFDGAKKFNLNIGNSVRGAPVIVVIIGSTIQTANASKELQKFSINVKPIVYPAVEEGKCRLRFFMSSLRTEEEVDYTLQKLKGILSDA